RSASECMVGRGEGKSRPSVATSPKRKRVHATSPTLRQVNDCTVEVSISERLRSPHTCRANVVETSRDLKGRRASEPQVDPVLLEVANEEVGDAEEHGQGSQAILQRGVARHNRMDRPLDHVVNDVGGERVLAKRAKEADLKAGDIAQRDEQRI